MSCRIAEAHLNLNQVLAMDEPHPEDIMHTLALTEQLPLPPNFRKHSLDTLLDNFQQQISVNF